MVADSHEELHAFAAKIGMKRSWFQEKTSITGRDLSHYDLVPNRRAKAIRMGAIEINSVFDVVMKRV